MMIKKIALMCAVVSMSAVSNEVIYDTDAQAGISTQFTYGPISEVQVQSRSALHLSARFFVTDADVNCSNAQVINENTWQVLAELPVQGNTAITGSLPGGFESMPKSLQITCYSDSKTYTVHHKIPAAPTINWESQVAVSGWVNGSHAGYYENINYVSAAFVNNNAPDGQCTFSNLVGQAPNVIESKQGLAFNSAHFSTEGVALADGQYVYRYVVSEIICKNAGGTTRAVEAWDLGYDHNPVPDRDYTVYSY
ncbi:hypothetical protein [Pseudoalteromonas luteoviolacea]|uniref:hypothetical protein n=1 Tax=Pseudoalteromonas luteoviolacea TaxID=43657 RepID=UPI00114DEEB2|nr:hypothetical protein [Pseudoalteromonas luteoviolacea]TQF71141.1 hypothetical protein FLM44_08645 [Pseudoalteromonas luteoviolacea]